MVTALLGFGSVAHASHAAQAVVSASPVELSIPQNVESVSSVPSFAARPSTYTVQSGDTLSRIAARFCGSSSAYHSLAAASGIANPNRIFPGQKIVLTCSGATSSKIQPKVIHAQTASVRVSGSASAVVAFAEAQVGKRYVWGSAGPNSFDCSGLVMAAFAHAGIKLPHQSGGIAGFGRSVSGPLQPGDLLFLSSKGGVYHVIIYVGGGQIVEAASPGQGVIKHAVYPYSFARRLM